MDLPQYSSSLRTVLETSDRTGALCTSTNIHWLGMRLKVEWPYSSHVHDINAYEEDEFKCVLQLCFSMTILLTFNVPVNGRVLGPL